MRKEFYTLNLNGTYCPEIVAICKPLQQAYCRKIGANYNEITGPYDLGLGPKAPKISGKFHMYELANTREPCISIFMDADALVSPSAWDYSTAINWDDPRGSVFSFGRDFAWVRSRAETMHDYFNPNLKDDKGNLATQTANQGCGFCTWLLICDHRSYKVWTPPTQEEALHAIEYDIHPTPEEMHIKCPASLLDDHWCGVNSAKYNLSVTYGAQLHKVAQDPKLHFFHNYLLNENQKIEQLKFWRDEVWHLNDTPDQVFARFDREFSQLKRQVRGPWYTRMLRMLADCTTPNPADQSFMDTTPPSNAYGNPLLIGNATPPVITPEMKAAWHKCDEYKPGPLTRVKNTLDKWFR